MQQAINRVNPLSALKLNCSALRYATSSAYIPPRFPPPGTRLSNIYNRAHQVTIFGIFGFGLFLSGIVGHAAYNRIVNGKRIKEEAMVAAQARKAEFEDKLN